MSDSSDPCLYPGTTVHRTLGRPGLFFSFLIYLPRSKHLHLMATPFNVFFRNYAPKGALPLLENIEEREDYGVSKAEQFTWKQLLDGYACTECGRCNTV